MIFLRRISDEICLSRLEGRNNHESMSRFFVPVARALSGSVCVLAFAACGATADPMQAPPLELFAWGESPAKTGARLADRGWSRSSSADQGAEGIEYELSAAEDQLPAELADGVEGMPLDHETVLPRYSVRLFAPEDRLRIASILRRDAPQVLRDFSANVLDAYGLDTPVWEQGPRETISAAGNATTDAMALYALPATLVVVHSVYFDAAEADMAEDPNSVLEVRLYSREHNEGLSGEALQQSLEQEFAQDD